MSQKEKDLKSLSRKELYNLVWKKPIMQIAKEYGLSDRGLGKLCEKYGIPTTPRGHWAKIASGQKIKKPPLLFSEFDNDGAKVLQPRVKTALSNNNIIEDEILFAEIREVVEFERLPENKIKVPAKMSEEEYHKVIKQHLFDKKSWDKTPLKPKDKRIFKILTTLLKALEVRGYSIYYNNSIYDIEVQNRMESVRVSISNYAKTYKRELTQEEIDKGYYKRNWKFDQETTNYLEITICNSYGRDPKHIIETDDIKLENLLNTAVIEITSIILRDRSFRLKREEEQHRYYLQQEAIRKEKERREELLIEIENKTTADKIRNYVAKCEEGYKSGKFKKPDFIFWKKWALNYADEIDPWVSQDED